MTSPLLLNGVECFIETYKVPGWIVSGIAAATIEMHRGAFDTCAHLAELPFTEIRRICGAAWAPNMFTCALCIDNLLLMMTSCICDGCGDTNRDELAFGTVAAGILHYAFRACDRCRAELLAVSVVVLPASGIAGEVA